MTMSRAPIPILLGTSLLAFLFSPAVGNESTLAETSRNAGRSVLLLPPVPHLDNIEWLNSRPDLDRQRKMPAPQVDFLSPLLVDPAIPRTRFSSSGTPYDLKFE